MKAARRWFKEGDERCEGFQSAEYRMRGGRVVPIMGDKGGGVRAASRVEREGEEGTSM